jgi:hypothetical protein
MTVDALRLLDKEFERVTQHRTRPVALISVVDDHELGSGGEAHAELISLLEKYGTCVRRSATVFEASGFRASVVRSMSTSVAMKSRSHFPRRTFNSVLEAVHWVSEGQEDQVEGAALLAAIESVRARRLHEANVRGRLGA